MDQPLDPEIEALYAAWADAFHREDVDAIFDLLTPDYVLVRAGAPALGQEQLRPLFAAVLQAHRITPAFEREEQIVDGDLAFERGWDIQTVENRADGNTRTQRSHVFLILRRAPDGRWRFARGMSQPERLA
jgi:uncharacterized protein (TIGR02246 family)